MPTNDVGRWADAACAAHPAGMNTQPTTVAAGLAGGFAGPAPVAVG